MVQTRSVTKENVVMNSSVFTSNVIGSKSNTSHWSYFGL